MTTLAELRRANLQEQRKKAEAAAQNPPAETEAAPASTAPVAQAPAPAQPAPTQPIAEAGPEPKVDLPAAPKIETPSTPVTHLNGHAQAVEPVVIPQPSIMGESTSSRGEAEPAAVIVDDAPDVDEADRKARAIMDRFYRGLAHKVVHPTGVKTTVDMPPDLFWRVKRYCHDHNNVTVRQLFLDLVIAVLEEEGY